MPIAAVYGRVSTTDQKDNGTSLEDQKTGGLRQAANLGATAPEEYVILEDWSGTDMQRPGLLRLYHLAEAGLIALVIILNLDRLYRPENDGDEWKIFLVMERLEDAGVKVIWTDPSMPSEGPLPPVLAEHVADELKVFPASSILAMTICLSSSSIWSCHAELTVIVMVLVPSSSFVMPVFSTLTAKAMSFSSS